MLSPVFQSLSFCIPALAFSREIDRVNMSLQTVQGLKEYMPFYVFSCHIRITDTCLAQFFLGVPWIILNNCNLHGLELHLCQLLFCKLSTVTHCMNSMFWPAKCKWAGPLMQNGPAHLLQYYGPLARMGQTMYIHGPAHLLLHGPVFPR